jgi:enoyl-CoA hydratase/carnithine racemase
VTGVDQVHLGVVEVRAQPTHVEILLWRADKRNAVNPTLARQLDQAVAGVEDCGLPLVIRSGTPGMFVAGTDLVALSRRTLTESLERLNPKVFQRIADYPWASVAVVDGPALGGGLELALACDIRVTTPGSLWGLPEVTLGLVPSAGGLYRLAGLVGQGKARELILTGRTFRGAEAAQIGLAQLLVEADDLDSALASLVERLSRADPLAVRLAKEAMRDPASDRTRLVDALAQATLIGTADTQSRIAERLQP